MQKNSNFFTSVSKFFVEIKVYVNERFESIFGKWAEVAYDYPFYCILATFLITAVCSIGFLPGIAHWVDGAEALYSLPFSEARSQGGVHHVLFNETRSRPSFIIVTGKNPNENILTWEHLKAVQQLDKLIRGQILDSKTNRRVALMRPGAQNVANIGDYFLESKYTSMPSLELNEESDKSSSKVRAGLFSNGRSYQGDLQNLLTFINSPSVLSPMRNSRGDAGSNLITFQDICTHNSYGECAVTGVQEMDIDLMLKLVLNPPEEIMLLVFDDLVFNSRGKAFPLHFLLGETMEKPCSPELPRTLLNMMYNSSKIMPASNPMYGKVNMSCVYEAKAFQLIYEIQENNSSLTVCEDWEKVLVDVLTDNEEFGPLKVTLNAFRSRDDALRSSTSESSDVLFVGLTFSLLLAYSTGLNFSWNLYRSKAYPAVSGLVASTLGLIAGMGVISMFGIAFVPTALVCPFLVIGVGTDDLFVILNGYSMTYMISSSRHRCITTLKETAFGITITTVTSLVTFLIGVNTTYLSIKNFCWFAGAVSVILNEVATLKTFKIVSDTSTNQSFNTTGMFFGYIFVFTLFFPVHCLDSQREGAMQACFFFLPSKNSVF